MAEEDVVGEVEAVEAVYGGDCVVLNKFPPHLHIHIKPRTAEISSQQFVEAVIGIRATHKYPDELPCITIVGSKGLDDRRQKLLVSSIRDKAVELSSCLMLVALCEGAVEELSSMNHPDGDCPLCLCPLVDEDANNDSLPFMKLMSCFHCFHCECIIRWWRWMKMQNETDHVYTSGSTTSSRDTEQQKGRQKLSDVNMGNCPVCRKPFLAKDIEHVLNLVGTYSQVEANENGVADEDNILHSELEKIRKQQFEAVLNLQRENDGLIEIKKQEVLLPGTFLPRPLLPPPPVVVVPEKETNEKAAGNSRNIRGGGGSSGRPSSSRHRKSYSQKQPHRGYNNNNNNNNNNNSGKNARQWVKKEATS